MRPKLLAWLPFFLVLAVPGDGRCRPRSPKAVLVLTEPGSAVSAESFALALSIQLQSLGLETVRQQWRRPKSPRRQEAEARRRARAAGSGLVVWYRVGATAGTAEARVFLSRVPGKGTRVLVLGPRQPGIERVMAMALRTMIFAELHGEKPVGKPLVVRETRPPEPMRRLQVVAGYETSLLPLGPELRHGPQGGMALRLWRRLELELVVGWAFADSGEAAGVDWEQGVLDITAGVTHAWSLSHRWQLVLGGRLRLGNVRARADDHKGRSESASLWELGIGPVVGTRLRLRTYLSAEVRLVAAWIPVGHHLEVAGRTATDPGGFLLMASAGARMAVW